MKSKWIADEGQKILRHDKLVQQNWERFRNGSFEDILSDELTNHLSKFLDRRPTLITLKRKYQFRIFSFYTRYPRSTICIIYNMLVIY